MINKKGFEFSFGWIFAIIVGAVIIFLAIYGATNLVREERKVGDTEAGKQLGIILNPLESGLESGRVSRINLPVESRVYNTCFSKGSGGAEKIFGAQDIAIASKSGIGNKWGEPGIPSTFYNKYIFSQNVIEDKEIIVFSKPLAMPYKIADVIFLIPERSRYCFVNPPQEIRDEMEAFDIKNINISESIKNCAKESEKVCFSERGCNIDINLDLKSVRKNKQTLYYEDDKENILIYGAIFSDNGIYECQIKRLMARAGELADLYKKKSESLSFKGCSSNLEGDLEIYANLTNNVNNSRDLSNIWFYAQEIWRRNDLLSCKLF